MGWLVGSGGAPIGRCRLVPDHVLMCLYTEYNYSVHSGFIVVYHGIYRDIDKEKTKKQC